MPNALLTAVSGLLAHQQMLNVTGNNLANLNTTGYKSQQVLFSDRVYETLRPASGSSATDVDGSNPVQVGSGSDVSRVRRNFGQSSLETTGGELDMAIQGSGFFVINNGEVDLLSRAGAFALDLDQYLVDPSTGYRVQRFGSVGEAPDGSTAYQDSGDLDIKIPLGTAVPGASTENVNVFGNLSVDAEGPTATQLSSITPFVTASDQAATLTTALNDLDSVVTPYAAGDFIRIGGNSVDGTTISVDFAVDDTTTVGELLSAIDTAFTGATSSINAAGNVLLTADEVGPSTLKLTLSDGPTNAGGINFNQHDLETAIVGTNGDQLISPVEFYDTLGRPHVLELTFERQQDNQLWKVSADIDATDGTIATTELGEVRFRDDGTFAEIMDSSNAFFDIEVALDGLDTPQSLRVNVGGEGQLAGLTQAAVGFGVSAQSDGYTAGTLYGVSISPDGMIMGSATNGRQVEIAQLAVATVANNDGLASMGDNFYSTTVNSGLMQIGGAASIGRGQVLAGQLEASNVDLAFEFTRLIVAQRGFSANARSITVADQVLEEVTNIIR
jgi:flagellar hook protein FlgE